MQMNPKLIGLNDSYINKHYRLLGFEMDINFDTFLPIKLSDVDVSIGNALRRIFATGIPTFAFSTNSIKLLANKSQFNSEVITQRISFITLNSNDLKSDDFDDLIFSICDSQDPQKPLKNNTNDIMFITLHQHLQIFKANKTPASNLVSKLIPYDSLLLTLKPGEEIHAVMKAVIGTGDQHIIWQSSIPKYKFETKLDSTDQLETNQDLMQYIGFENKKPIGIILTIQSIGKLKSINVIHQGIEILIQKLEFFKQNVIDHNNSQFVSVERNADVPNLIKLKIINEDYTLGNVVETACLNKLQELIKIVSQNINNDDVTASQKLEMELLLQSLVAFKKPHPLSNYGELLIRTPQKYPIYSQIKGYQEIDDSGLRLLLLAIDDVLNICQSLLKDAQNLVQNT